MSDTAMAGKAVPWEHGGKEYLLGATDIDLELLFQTVHEVWARQRIEATRQRVGERIYSVDVDRHGDRVAANRFAFNGPISLQFISTPEGMFEYLLLKLQKGATEGGAAISRAALKEIRKGDSAVWDSLREEVLKRDFPLVFAPESPATETP